MRNDWYSRYSAAVSGVCPVNPDLLPAQEDLTEQRVLTHPEIPGDGGAEAMDVIPLSGPTSGEEPSSFGQTLAPAAGQSDSQPAALKEDGTARQIMQLLQEIQNPHPLRTPPFLGENPCIPFFYRPDEQDEVKILVV